MCNGGVFGVELRDFGCLKGVVLVWNRCVELRAHIGSINIYSILIYYNKNLLRGWSVLSNQAEFHL